MTFDPISRTARFGESGSDHRISGPAELLEAIPFLLGFRPARSVVLVGLAHRRSVVVARIDLDEASDVVPRTVPSMVRGGARDFVVVVFDDDADPTRACEPLPWEEVGLLAAEHVERAGCGLVDVMLVARGRWWSYECDSPTCCPPEGRPLPAAPSPFAAAATVAGVVVMPDRESVAAQLEPAPDRDRLLGDLLAAELAAVGRIVRGGAGSPLAVKRALFAAARASSDPGWNGVDDADLVRFGVALRSIEFRDPVWLAIDAGRLDGRPLWRQLARQLPAPFAATPLFLFAWRTWRLGDGTLSRMAAERALVDDPGLSAAELLLTALSVGLNPRRLPRLHSRPRAQGLAG